MSNIKQMISMEISKRSLLGLAYSASLVLVSLLSFSCSSEAITEVGVLPENGYPLRFNVVLDGHVSARAGGKDSWTNGDKIGVRLYDKTSVYQISNDANSLEPSESSETLYWKNTAKSVVKAWFPADKQDNVNISDQSSGYSNFDFLYAEKEMTFTSVGTEATLSFKHLMSKVECTVTTDYSDLTVNSVKFLGIVQGSFDTGVVSASSVYGDITPEESLESPLKYTAILFPMQIKRDEFFIRVDTNKGEFVFKLGADTDNNLKAGFCYKFNFEIKSNIGTGNLKLRSLSSDLF